jgi:hypothetical protein
MHSQLTKGNYNCCFHVWGNTAWEINPQLGIVTDTQISNMFETIRQCDSYNTALYICERNIYKTTLYTFVYEIVIIQLYTFGNEKVIIQL